MSPLPSRRSSLRLATSLAITIVLLACGGAPTERPKEQRAELAEAQAPAASAAPAAPSMERDMSGRGVAGGFQTFSSGAADTGAAPPSPQPPPSPNGASVQATAETAPASMIIRSGVASVEVDSLERAIALVRTVAQRAGGFVANTAMTAGREQVRSATLELKVPSPKFDEVVGGLSPLGRVESVNVQAQDVGEEYVDVAARETNARRLEARLIELLANRTGKLTDVLAVEHELARVREDIERMEGRMRFLRARTAMSTLSVTVHKPLPIIARPTGSSPITEAFREAWRNFVGFAAWLIAASGVLVPLGVLGALAWVLTRRWRATWAAQQRATIPRTTPPPTAAPPV